MFAAARSDGTIRERCLDKEIGSPRACRGCGKERTFWCEPSTYVRGKCSGRASQCLLPLTSPHSSCVAAWLRRDIRSTNYDELSAKRDAT